MILRTVSSMPPCYNQTREQGGVLGTDKEQPRQRTTRENSSSTFLSSAPSTFFHCHLRPAHTALNLIAPSKMPSASTEDPDRPSEIEPSEIEIEAVARKMFYGGCALLPWLWLVNIIYFRKLYFSPECPPGVKKWVGRSSIGFLVVTTLWIIWCIIFQTTYKSWGTALLVVPVDDGSW